MAATPYKPISWGDEPVFKDKLNAMANNEQWLFENTPKMLFNTYGIKRSNGIKVLAGIAVVNPTNEAWAHATVSFGTFFSSGCKPVIVTGTQPTTGRWRYQTIFRGIGGYYPDHRGMIVSAGAYYYGTSVASIVDGKVYVHYVAIGW